MILLGGQNNTNIDLLTNIFTRQGYPKLLLKSKLKLKIKIHNWISGKGIFRTLVISQLLPSDNFNKSMPDHVFSIKLFKK